MSYEVQVPQSRRYVRARPRQDITFAWAKALPGCRPWRALLAEWVSTRRGPRIARDAGIVLLDFAREQAHQPVSPEDLCRQNHPSVGTFAAWIQQRNAAQNTMWGIHQFFEWFIERKGPLARVRGHVNPIAKPVMSRRGSETTRRVIPLHYIHRLRELLTGDDWAWAKTVPHDWGQLTDANTGETQPTWSPVRAHALALLLMLPLRSFQVRVLDSGEADEEKWVEGRWEPNKGPLALTAKRGRRQGFVRRFTRAGGDDFTGFFINTNKTRHSQSGEVDPGYELPWEHPEAIRIASELRSWQERYNPIQRPSTWSEVAYFISDVNGMDRQGDACFLFRDPLSSKKDAPVSYFSIVELWTRLLSELQTRLARDGERRADGSPIQLLLDRKRRVPVYDLHSIRVSLLSHLARDGNVPLHILSKHVAGHASIVMTLHYIKTDPSEISATLSEASARLASNHQEAFARHLAQNRFDETSFVSNDTAGGRALRASDPSMWIQMPTGYCPVAQSRCEDGGPQMGKNRFASVPGGPRNCTLCRFHITGPAFLEGLVARFNATSGSYEFAREELARATTALEEAENRLFDAEQAGQVHGRAELARARARHHAAVRQVEELLTILYREYDLVERSKTAARGEGLNLVLSGPFAHVDTAIRGTSQVELWDAICQAAHVDAPPILAHAVERRGKALDQLLLASGAAPVFLNLDHESSLAAGNQMMRLRVLQLGPDRAFRAIDGRLSEIGFDPAERVRERLRVLSAPPEDEVL